MREINWAIQRMRRIVAIWRKLDVIDRMFMIRKLRDECPREFLRAYYEKWL